MALAAVVVCHNSKDSKLRETLAVLQRHENLAIFVACDGETPDNLSPGVKFISVAKGEYEDQLTEALRDLTDYQWVWALSDWQVPNPSALAELVAVSETSTTAAIIAPKLMRADDSKIINQFGLTLTPRSSLHRMVNDELDQAQFDNLEEALGASLEGALVSPERLNRAGGTASALQGLAADLELSIRLRLKGHRVLLAPRAKVLGTNPERPLDRAADMQLKLFYFSPLASFAFWLFLPVLVIVEALWLLLKKQPEKIARELAAGLKVFFTAFRIWSARRLLSRVERKNLMSLKPLYASKNQVADARNLQLVSEPELATAAITVEPTLRYFASGAAWVALALLIVSWQYWPQNIDATAAGLIPLGDSWLRLFAATGSGFQNIGVGYFGPSDPFNWLLLFIGSLTPWSPGVAMVTLFFAAKSLAFSAAFKAISLVTNRTWLAILAALSYAFWPAFTIAQADGRLAQVVAHLLVPILAFALAKVIGVKTRNPTKAATWAYTAIAALTAAALSACAPVLTILIAAAWLLFAIYRSKKIGYLIWIPLPLVVLWFPTAWYRVATLFEPASLLADPGLPLNRTVLDPLKLVIGGWSSESTLLATIGVGILVASCLIALLRKPALATWLWIGLVLSVAAAWAFQHLRFANNSLVGTATGDAWVNGSPFSILSITGLLCALLLAVSIDGLKWSRALAIAIYPAVGLLGLMALQVPSTLTYSDGRVVPALIRAEAKQSSALKLLVIRAETSTKGRFSATLVSGDGIHLADLNTSYRFALASQDYSAIAQLSADLVSASPEQLGEKLKDSKIGYVLIPDEDSEENRLLVSNVDSVIGLKTIGLTDFGHLWRVEGIENLPKESLTQQDYWSVTKGLQLTVLLVFGLLAIPTRRREGTKPLDESELDSFAESETDE